MDSNLTSQNINQGSVSNANDQQQEINLEIYKKRLLEDLRLDDLPEEQLREYEEKIEALVNDRIINLILIHLPEEQTNKFADMMENSEIEQVMDFVGQNIPNFADKILTELMDIRDELLEGVRGAQQAKTKNE